MPLAAQSVNHITDAMLEEAPLIRDVIGPFIKYIQGSILVGQNIIGFDGKILKHYAEEFGYKFDFEMMDTMIMAKNSDLNLPRYRGLFIRSSLLMFIFLYLNLSFFSSSRSLLSKEISFAYRYLISRFSDEITLFKSYST